MTQCADYWVEWLRTNRAGRVVKIVSSSLTLPLCLFSPCILSPVRLLPFNYSVIFKKSRRRTACSSRGSYSTILPEILLFARFSRIQWTETAFDTTMMRRAEPFRRIGEEGGREGNDSEQSADKAEVSRPRDNCQRKRDKTFFIPSSSLSLWGPMNAVEILITAINARKILLRFVDSSADALT